MLIYISSHARPQALNRDRSTAMHNAVTHEDTFVAADAVDVACSCGAIRDSVAAVNINA